MKIQGLRKFFLGLIFMIFVVVMGSGIILLVDGPHVQKSLLGLAALTTAMSAGIGTIVWGNIQEHKIQNGFKDAAN